MTLRSMIVSNARRLGLFVFVVTALVFAMFFITRRQIHHNEHQLMVSQLESVLASVHYDNDLLAQVAHLHAPTATGVSEPMPYYLARHGNTTVAVVFTVVAPEGYSGPIRLLIGMKPSGEIIAVRVIAHTETPGLGDGIDIKKSSWITQFAHQSLHKTPLADWKVKKDGGSFDQLTGATITPRAVVKAIRALLVFYRANKTHLLPHLDKQEDKYHASLPKDSD